MNIILNNIKTAIDKIEWQSETKKKKAIELCEAIFHLYILDGGDFNNYRSLSASFFKKIIKTSDYIYDVKNNLIDYGIIEVDNSYDVKKHISKGYRFNQELLQGKYVLLCSPKHKHQETNVLLCSPNQVEVFEKFCKSNSVSQNFINLFSSINTTISTTSNPTNPTTKGNPYYYCYPKLETYIYQGLSKIKFDENVQTWIDTYEIKREHIKVDDEITTKYFDIIVNNKKLRFSLDKAKATAKKNGKSLIELKDKFYIEDVDSFLERKTIDARLIFEYSIANIENKKFRCRRNETNRRLDYNLTNMKSDLINFITVDGEKLVELDIANAQFAILNYIVKDLDINFIEQSSNGTLYNSVEKIKMFRIAFDKIKKEQDEVRSLFPKTMKFIDNFKGEYGYESFSNLLQNAESLIMIDGLLPRLMEKGYEVFPIHDAIRVKESQSEIVKKEIEDYFNEIGFVCKLRIKNKSKAQKEIAIERIEILYKGFKKVLIDKPTNEEKRLFIDKINELGGNPPEWMIMESNLFEHNKLWFFYNKWREKNPYDTILEE